MFPAVPRLVRRAPWLVFLAWIVTPGVAVGAQLTLSWTDNATNEGSYRVERKIGNGGSYSQIAVLAANSAGYTDANLAASTTYCYRVRAFNAVGVSALFQRGVRDDDPERPQPRGDQVRDRQRNRRQLAERHQLRERLRRSLSGWSGRDAVSHAERRVPVRRMERRWVLRHRAVHAQRERECDGHREALGDRGTARLHGGHGGGNAEPGRPGRDGPGRRGCDRERCRLGNPRGPGALQCRRPEGCPERA